MTIDGSKIRVLREKANITLAQLGNVAGVSDIMMGYIERNKRAPNIDVTARVADYFEVTIDSLRFDEK